MNSRIFFFILLILAGAIIFGFTVKRNQPQPEKAISVEGTNTEQLSTLQTQTKTIGAIEVEVTPISVEPGKDIIFELVMNNHSVDLDYDYTKIVALTDDQGNSLKPTQWTGNTSGHHIKGELVFSALPERTKELTLTLDGVDNKKETFTW